MDGVGIVAAIIIVCFFSSFELNPVNPAAPKPSTTIQTSESTPEYNNNSSVVQQQSAQYQTQPQYQQSQYQSSQAYQAQTTQSGEQSLGDLGVQRLTPAGVDSTAAQYTQTSATAQNPDYSAPIYQFVAYDRMDAVIKRYNPSLSESEANQIKMSTNLYCKEKDIDPRLALAVMARESRFNPNAVSSSGAIGLGQIMPFNYADLGITNPNDINQNVKGTVYYLSQKIADWSGRSNQVQLALASYLRGTGDIQRSGGQYDDAAKAYVEEILRIRASI
ncbi:putative lytic murein transglycosylase [Candidatus Termititenax dinenymphae]|uniref:Lytic murein transglycosylase n=1 Tax=Candidatus Termititenax dinenymphae TaxID=2218523 RepID=A0A388TKB5_9BACT|nr:putative lytic murein transglycosylase [Candidatus Termititenax dinenymphae]